MNSLLHRN